jgi:hypothetical protein
MSSTSNMRRKLRRRREHRQFESALRNASPAMQQELLAAATRQLTR